MYSINSVHDQPSKIIISKRHIPKSKNKIRQETEEAGKPHSREKDEVPPKGCASSA